MTEALMQTEMSRVNDTYVDAMKLTCQKIVKQKDDTYLLLLTTERRLLKKWLFPPDGDVIKISTFG